jgi:hypothetical protein
MRFTLFLLFLALLTPAHAGETWFKPRARKPRGQAGDSLVRASQIALTRAHPQTTWHCWRYVKDALLAARAVEKRPESAWAKHAGEELCKRHGFTKLELSDPYAAPVGAVIVYGGADAGHVEFRSEQGFVSDFVSSTPYPRPLVGIYVKRS